MAVPRKSPITMFNPLNNGLVKNASGIAGMASGGSVSIPHKSGLFDGDTGGRTDVLHRTVPVDSHVIPADIVSGLGEGNTKAGSAILDKILNHGSKEITPRQHAFSAHIKSDSHVRAGKPSHTQIIAASGEYLVPPNKVAEIGNGDIKKGHEILDKFILHVRKKTAEKLKKLPGPKK